MSKLCAYHAASLSQHLVQHVERVDAQNVDRIVHQNRLQHVDRVVNAVATQRGQNGQVQVFILCVVLLYASTHVLMYHDLRPVPAPPSLFRNTPLHLQVPKNGTRERTAHYPSQNRGASPSADSITGKQKDSPHPASETGNGGTEASTTQEKDK